MRSESAILLVGLLTSGFCDAADEQVAVARVGDTEYRDLQSAIDAAESGAVVKLGPGTFHGPFRITKPVTLEGSGVATTTLTAEWRTFKDVVVDGKGIPPEQQQRYRELRKVAVDVEHGEG